MNKFWSVCFGLMLCSGVTAVRADTLETVKSRGSLVCGVNTGLAGFSIPDDSGHWTGLDVDFCRAVATAVLGDPSKVRYVPLSAKTRFTALQSGEIDLLSRNSTWTSSRDSTLGIVFSAVSFYDGQGFMAPKKSMISSVKELNGASICVQQGSTSELNLADYFRTNGLKYSVVVFEGEDDVVRAFEAGRCDVVTNDMSALSAERIRLPKPDDYVVLPEIISKEPLTPAVRQGDDRWLNIVKWTHFAMLNAEEAGITSKNVDDMLKSENPDVRRLLGVEGDTGRELGIDSKWVYNIVKSVGNYGESFERNLGETSPLKLKRGVNALWNKGGLQYAPPVR